MVGPGIPLTFKNQDLLKRRGYASKISFLLFLLFYLSSCGSKQICINEISLGDSKVLRDEKGKTDAWVELYNATGRSIDLAGYFLSDKIEKPTKWKFPEGQTEKTTIEKKGYLLVWVDKDEKEGLLHTNFNLDNGGESLYLFSSDGHTLVDSARVIHMPEGYTYCREHDGSSRWVFTKRGSPGESNAKWNDSVMVAALPQFTLPPGFYKDSIKVEINTDYPDADIYYSLDGSIPNPDSSFKYASPIWLSKTAVLRARVVKNGYLPGPVFTSTYFFNESSSLPIVSLVLDPPDLWDEQKGLYVMYHREYEKNGHFEYFLPDGKFQINLDLGVKITGFTSRILKKKSFRLIARNKYGPNDIRYKFFKDTDVDEFGGLVLRADASTAMGGGPGEIAGERIRNELIYAFNKDMGSTVDMQCYQPIILFLNGEYWGIYTMVERKNGQFIRSHHKVDKIDVIDDEDVVALEGDDEDYNAMVDSLNLNDPTKLEYFAFLEANINVLNFIDNWVYNIYMNAYDHEVNTRCWRERKKGAKWHWIAFDKDGWGEYDEKLLTELYEMEVADVNLILGRVLRNREFRNVFIARTCDFMNTVMLPEKVSHYVDEITKVIEKEKPRDRQRWSKVMKYLPTGEQIKWLKEFGKERPDFLRAEMKNLFQLSGTAALTLDVEPKNAGEIRISTIAPNQFPWTGIYFQGIPISLEAIPAHGYAFNGWNLPAHSTEKKISLMPKAQMTIIARFEK